MSKFIRTHKLRHHIYSEKTIEGYWNPFDFIIFEKIISKKSNIVSDRTTKYAIKNNVKNEIYGSLVTIQHHTKCTNLLSPKSQAIKDQCL